MSTDTHHCSSMYMPHLFVFFCLFDVFAIMIGKIKFQKRLEFPNLILPFQCALRLPETCEFVRLCPVQFDTRSNQPPAILHAS
jgi:hypothetical protein